MNFYNNGNYYGYNDFNLSGNLRNNLSLKQTHVPNGSTLPAKSSFAIEELLGLADDTPQTITSELSSVLPTYNPPQLSTNSYPYPPPFNSHGESINPQAQHGEPWVPPPYPGASRMRQESQNQPTFGLERLGNSYTGKIQKNIKNEVRFLSQQKCPKRNYLKKLKIIYITIIRKTREILVNYFFNQCFSFQ